MQCKGNELFSKSKINHKKEINKKSIPCPLQKEKE